MNVQQNHVAKMIHITDIQEGDLLDLGEGGQLEITRVEFNGPKVTIQLENDRVIVVGVDRPIVVQRWMS